MLLISDPQCIDNFHIDAPRQFRRRAGDRDMRSGETEDAMRAAVTIGIAGWQFRSVLTVVMTNGECRSGLCIRGGGKSAERDQKALRGDGIGNDDADQRSPKCLSPHAGFQHAAAHHPAGSMRTVNPKVNADSVGPSGKKRPAGRDFISAACA